MREWLKKLRIKNGLSRKFMAKELGICEMGYSQIENGYRQRDIGLSFLVCFSKVFNVSIDEIIKKEQQWLRQKKKEKKGAGK